MIYLRDGNADVCQVIQSCSAEIVTSIPLVDLFIIDRLPDSPEYEEQPSASGYGRSLGSDSEFQSVCLEQSQVVISYGSMLH